MRRAARRIWPTNLIAVMLTLMSDAGVWMGISWQVGGSTGGDRKWVRVYMP